MTAPTRPRPSPSRRGLGDRTFGLLLTLPAMALLGAVVVYPLIAGITTSLFRQSLVIPGRSFAGLDNFRAVLNEQFWPVLRHTVVFTLGATVGPVFIGFALALALNANIRGRAVLRGLFLFPWVIPGVVVSFVWLWIFNANYGLLNGILVGLDLVDEPVVWLGSPNTAMLAIVVAKTWASFPWIMVMLLAGLQTVPTTLYEAAALDGAGVVSRFRHVTMPHLRGILGIVVLLELIWNFQHFDMIYVLTNGGPAGSTTTFAVEVYDLAFKGFDLGKASALGALWLVLLMALVVVYVRISERGEKA